MYVCYQHDSQTSSHAMFTVFCASLQCFEHVYNVNDQCLQCFEATTTIELHVTLTQMMIFSFPGLVELIMVKNRSNIYIADKSFKFCRDVRFGLLEEKIWPHAKLKP